MLWLSHWTFEDELEGGDQVHISMAAGWCCVKECGWCCVKECGIRLIHKQEERGSQSDNEGMDRITSRWYPNIADADMSAYKLGKADYFLCHYDYLVHQLAYPKKQDFEKKTLLYHGSKCEPNVIHHHNIHSLTLKIV
jgi:hypothetical protein